MASNPPSTFDRSDRYLIRLRKMCEAGSTKGLHKLLKWLNPTWMPPTSFKEYLKTEKNVTMKAFNSALKTHQKNALKKDPEGNSYDISLLYILILWGNEGLAHKDDVKWQKKSGCLEYLITAVKNVRNDLMHTYDPIDDTEFLKRTETLRCLLKDMFTAAITTCNHIKQADIDQTLQDLDSLINKVRDDPLDPQDFAAYKNQLLFSQQCDFVKVKGTISLQKRHSKYSSLTPVSHLVKENFPVDDVFTDMLVKDGSKQNDKLKMEDLLEAQRQSSTDDLIFVEGEAGLGKTTLTKKLLIDWIKKNSKIKHIETYDLLIHAECREHVESFKGLLDSSMPDVSKSFQGEDLKFVTLGLRSLIIIDGLDELNTKSTKLFIEILKLKKDYDITVLVTSRPEAVEKYFQFARSYQIDTKHIVLLGIPVDQREIFVKRYYDGIAKTGAVNQSIDGLIRYLRRTEHRLGYLWRSPYNLSIVTILWSLKPDVVNSITTAPELHWEIHQLSLSKLKERLLDHEATQHLRSSQLEKKLKYFMYKLCRESLVALANDDVTLPQEAYQRLENTCHELGLPVEEMIGAFLKRISTNSGIRYSFPHKGLQDFLAAHFIWMRLTATLLSSDVQNVIKDVNDALTKNAVPIHVCQTILRITEGELIKESSKDAIVKPQQYDDQVITKGVDDFLTQNSIPAQIRQNTVSFIEGELKKANPQNTIDKLQNFEIENVEKIIESVMKTDGVPEELSQAVSILIDERFKKNPQDAAFSSTGTPKKETAITKIIIEETSSLGLLPEMPKFQNLFISLLGIFFMDSSSNVKDETKMEALTLLQKTGVKDKDAWLNILNSVRCDGYVATFISNQPNVLEGNILLTDSTLFAYISLMQALKHPSKGVSTICIDLVVKGDLTGADDLLNLISLHQYKVKSILMNDNNFVEYTSLLKSLPVPLKDAHEVNIDIHVNEDLLEVRELMSQIKNNNFIVRMLEIKDGEIDDCNLKDYVLVLKSMPQLLSNASQMGVDINIKGDLTGADELLQLLNIYQFKVKSIFVNDKNLVEYTEQLKNLKTPLKEPHNINLDLELNGTKSLSELVNQIKSGNFLVRTLKVKDFQINDSEMNECLSMLKSFPQLLKSANQTIIDVNISGDSVGIEELLELLNTHHFKIERILITRSNFLTYTSILNALRTPCKDAHEVNIDVHADEELEHLGDLMYEIKKKKFTVAMLHVKESQINNNNFTEYISLLESLPHLSEEANQTSIYIDIEEALTGAEELLQLISTHHFQVKRITITDFNFVTYTSMLKTLQTPLRDPHKVIVDIQVNENLLNLCNLMIEIKKNDFVVRKLRVKKIKIDNLNIGEYISILRSFPPLLKDANEASVDLIITGDLTGAEELLQLICIHQFKVRRMLVTDSNIKKYTSQLETLTTPFGNAHQVAIDIDITREISGISEFLNLVTVHQLQVRRISMYNSNYMEYSMMLRGLQAPLKDAHAVSIDLKSEADFLGVKELMEQIKEKNFQLKLLRLGKVMVTEDNLLEYTAALRSLPTVPRGGYKGRRIRIHIDRETSGVKELLDEVSRTPIPLEVYLTHNFRYPTSQLPLRDAISSVFGRCKVERYKGPVTEGMVLPLTLQRLYASVADLGGYAVMNKFLKSRPRRLRILHVCASACLPAQKQIEPLTSVRHAPVLYITDVGEENISNVAALARKLQPARNNAWSKFHAIFFPRATLSTQGIRNLLTEMTVTASYVVFPSQCKPASPDEENLQEIACDRSIRIHWGVGRDFITNIDDW